MHSIFLASWKPYKKILFIVIGCFLCTHSAIAQNKKNSKSKKKVVAKKTHVKTKQPLPLNLAANSIEYSTLNKFYDKLLQLQSSDSSVVRIVQIGDSHIQANYLSDVLRTGFQTEFGNAGRGLIFPFQMARTNSAEDIKSSGSTGWKVSKIIQAQNIEEVGSTGFSLHTIMNNANFSLEISSNTDSNNRFSRIKLITDTFSKWALKTQENDTIILSALSVDPLTKSHHIILQEPTNIFNLRAIDSLPNTSFYGAIVETGLPGVIFNNIGVNGAKFEQYNQAPLFWKQLPNLAADLYILSLGTNEAQTTKYDETTFLNAVDACIKKIKAISPDADILITTAIDSYKRGKSNRELQSLNASLVRYCRANQIALWNGYRVTLGYGAARHWLRHGLLSKDKVHFTKEGYQLQGRLFFQSLLEGYKKYKASN